MNIIPRNYRIVFEPDLKSFIFKGTEKISFHVRESIKEIVLDVAELKIRRATLFFNKTNLVTSFKVDEKKEKLFLQLAKELKPGTYGLHLEFQGKLNDRLAGFYRSKYMIGVKEKYLATTQFEATDAKRAFPCIDHPSFKATFDITVIAPEQLIVISNTFPVEKKKMAHAQKMTRFATTPVMATYLLYIGVGEFEIRKDRIGSVIVRAVTTPGKAKYTQFAIDCAKKFLPFYQNYFNFPYPLEKLDLIAIPDCSFGAMENWGAITFRENALLFYPGKSGKSTMQHIAEIIAHEIVHQWFGNLVTMKWWDDLWLNESFATYMAYKAVDHFWPEWSIWADYVSEGTFAGMDLDALKSSHPIKVTVSDTRQIDELFDEIAYEKGGSILRMTDLYLGEKTFKSGLRAYIQKFQYANAQASDLWQKLEQVSRTSVKGIMESFLTQTGFPLITSTLTSGKLTLKQSRFLYMGEDINSVWRIPMVLRFLKQRVPYLLKAKEAKLRISQQNNLVNVNSTYAGFYISQYDNPLLQIVGENQNKLASIDRLGLIHDLFILLKAQKQSLAQVIGFLQKYYIGESDPDVLMYLISKLTSVYILVKINTVKQLAIHFSKKSLEITDLNPRKKEDTKITFLRNRALSCLSFFGDKKVVKYLQSWFNMYLTKESSLEADLRAVTYASVAWSDSRNYRVLLRLYKESQIQEEKIKLLSALANVKDSKSIKKTLDYSLSSEVRFANILAPVSVAAHNPYARETVFQWLLTNFAKLKRRTGGHAITLLGRILKYVVPQCGIGHQSEAFKFFQTHKIAGLEKTYKQMLERLEINSRFVRKYKS